MMGILFFSKHAETLSSLILSLPHKYTDQNLKYKNNSRLSPSKLSVGNPMIFVSGKSIRI